MASLWVMLGSALAGLLRYWLGVRIAALGERGLFSDALGRGHLDFVDLRAFVMIGLCGGFTTFSSFSLQALELLQAGRTGPALGYMAGSVLACLLAVWAG